MRRGMRLLEHEEDDLGLTYTADTATLTMYNKLKSLQMRPYCIRSLWEDFTEIDEVFTTETTYNQPTEVQKFISSRME